jgi:hypothetical protein
MFRLVANIVSLIRFSDRWLGYVDLSGKATRLCRLPPHISEDSPIRFHGTLVAAGSKDGVVTVLDVSTLLPSEVVSNLATI